MLFQVNYTPVVRGSAAENHESMKRGLNLFGKWSPPTTMEVQAFYARADNKGGTVIVKTDDVMDLYDAAVKFVGIEEFEIVPIMEIGDAVVAQTEAVRWAETNV